MKKILIIGDFGFVKIIQNLIESENTFKVFGVITNKSKEDNLSVLDKIKDIQKIIAENDIFGGVLAVENGWHRKRIHDKIIGLYSQFNFLTVIHPNAVVGKNVRIGKGCILQAGVVVNSDSVIGDFCLLKTNSSLGHEGVLQKFSSIFSGVITGGNLSLGAFSEISLGSHIIENISIGKHSLICAGSLVLKNISNNKIVNGIPAKVIRGREEGEDYFYRDLSLNSY